MLPGSHTAGLPYLGGAGFTFRAGTIFAVPYNKAKWGFDLFYEYLPPLCHLPPESPEASPHRLVACVDDHQVHVMPHESDLSVASVTRAPQLAIDTTRNVGSF